MSDQYPQHDPSGAQSQPPYSQPYQPRAQPYGQEPYGLPGHQQQAHPQAYGAAPTPMSPEDERTWGAISHGGALAAMILSAGFLGFFGSLAVYILHKDRGPFVRSHAANSLNVQITMFAWLVVATVLYVVLGLVSLGIGFVVLWPIFFVPPVIAGVLHVVGTLKAYNGEWWNPPLTPRLVK